MSHITEIIVLSWLHFSLELESNEAETFDDIYMQGVLEVCA